MSVFDRRPLRTNICKYANLISLFSSHWTIRTMAWTLGKSYCVGVRRFMFEAWQFLLAHRARLPDTVDFVLYELLYYYMRNTREEVTIGLSLTWLR